MFLSHHEIRGSHLRRVAIVSSVLVLLIAATMSGAFVPRAHAQDDTTTPTSATATSTAEDPDDTAGENDDTGEGASGTSTPPTTTEAVPTGPFEVDDSSLRWGINIESSTKGLAPGTFNLMSAGDISGAFTGPYQTIDEDDWKATDGSVTIEKLSESGATSVAGWEDTQTDKSGAPLRSNGDHSGLEAVFTGGEGIVDPEEGTAKIEFEGTITVLYYSGYMYSTISDPYLEVTPTSAKVKATLGGHKSSRTDTRLWEPLDPVEDVTIADLDDVDVSQDLEGPANKGISVLPEWDGVTYENPDTADQVRMSAAGVPWGSFPKDFVDFQVSAGAGEYWYTTGGGPDKSKKPLVLSVSWVAGDPVDPITSDEGGDYESILRNLLNNVIDDTGNWAGEATKDALKQTFDNMSGAITDPVESGGTAEGGASPSQGTGGAGAPGGSAAPSIGGYSGAVNATGNYYSNYTYTDSGSGGNDQPSTNGTQQYNAGSAQSSNPSSGIIDPAASYDGIGASYVADNPTSPVTYALTGADSMLDGFGRNWQWWIGGLLLASALGTVLIAAFRGKA